ncbi:hypothetical protein [Salinicola halimionae]|nr:hypothetical protein [Salinicola halimionae]
MNKRVIGFGGTDRVTPQDGTSLSRRQAVVQRQGSRYRFAL